MEVKLRVEAFGEVVVQVDKEKKDAYAKGFGCRGWATVNDEGEIFTDTNDISTNYLVVCMAKALDHAGVKVQIPTPSPQNRMIEVLD